jgi:gas vesicle protein
MKGQAVFGYLAAGVGIGAAISIFLAPQSGEDTRKWVANKCFDAVEAANEKIRQSHAHVKDVMDRGPTRD